MVKLLYKPVGLLVGVLESMLARTISKKVWKLAAGARQPADGSVLPDNRFRHGLGSCSATSTSNRYCLRIGRGPMGPRPGHE